MVVVTHVSRSRPPSPGPCRGLGGVAAVGRGRGCDPYRGSTGTAPCCGRSTSTPRQLLEGPRCCRGVGPSRQRRASAARRSGQTARHGSSRASRSSAAARAGRRPGEDHPRLVADEGGQVAGLPPDDRRPWRRGPRRRPCRTVPASWAARRRRRRRGRAVPSRSSMSLVHDPVAEDGEAASDPLGVGRLDVVPAGEVSVVRRGGGPVRRATPASPCGPSSCRR